MSFSEFVERVQGILKDELPEWESVGNELKALGFIPCTKIDQPFHRMIEQGEYDHD